MIQQQVGAPTMIQYSEFDKAFDFLNGALFRRGASQGSGHFQQEAKDAWLLLSRQVGEDQRPRGPGRRTLF